MTVVEDQAEELTMEELGKEGSSMWLRKGQIDKIGAMEKITKIRALTTLGYRAISRCLNRPCQSVNAWPTRQKHLILRTTVKEITDSGHTNMDAHKIYASMNLTISSKKRCFVWVHIRFVFEHLI